MIPIISRRRLNTISVSAKPFPGSERDHKITASTADLRMHADLATATYVLPRQEDS